MQAKSASETDSHNVSVRGAIDSGLLDLLEGKLAVLQFQMKIKEELDSIASKLEASPDGSESTTNDPNFLLAVQQKANELSMDLKNITQLYNEYAVPFELWEVSHSFIPL